jgi:hypothetical protein
MKTNWLNRWRRRGGFTLAEMSISLFITTAATAGCLIVFISFLYSYNTTTLMRDASYQNSMGLDRMVYGVGTNDGLREAFSNSVAITNLSTGWKISYSNAAIYSFSYSNATQVIQTQTGKVICTNVIASSISNLIGGCQISVTVATASGVKIWTNTMGTIVQFRN